MRLLVAFDKLMLNHFMARLQGFIETAYKKMEYLNQRFDSEKEIKSVLRKAEVNLYYSGFSASFFMSLDPCKKTCCVVYS